MNKIIATAKYLRLSPTKTRLVINNIRGKQVDVALNILQYSPAKPALSVSKLLKSAIANAINNHQLKREDLIVKSVMANQGPVLKRFMPRAFGRADVIRKSMTHIRLELESTAKEEKPKEIVSKVKSETKKTVKSDIKKKDAEITKTKTKKAKSVKKLTVDKKDGAKS